MNIKKDVALIYANIDTIKNQGIKKNFDIEMKFLNDYPELYDKYPFLVKKIISGKDLDVLDKMLSSLDKINKENADKFEEEKKLGEILKEKYIK